MLHVPPCPGCEYIVYRHLKKEKLWQVISAAPSCGSAQNSRPACDTGTRRLRYNTGLDNKLIKTGF